MFYPQLEQFVFRWKEKVEGKEEWKEKKGWVPHLRRAAFCAAKVGSSAPYLYMLL